MAFARPFFATKLVGDDVDSQSVLVTGANGFVGRYLVEALLVKNYRLTLAVRTASDCPPAWRDIENIRLVETRAIETSLNIDEAFSEVSAVLHLAGRAHVLRPELNTKGRLLASNTSATRALVEAAIRHRVSKFIHLSSLAAVTENVSLSIISDETSREPKTTYGRSKKEAEHYVKSLLGAGIFYVNLRPALIVGPQAKGNWAALQRIAASGLPLPLDSIQNSRSMIGVRTIAEAITHVCSGNWSHEAAGNYCIASADPIATRDAVALLRKGMGLPTRLFATPPAALTALALILGQQRRFAGLLGNLQVDSRRFFETFGFQETQSLRDAILDSGSRYMLLRRKLPGRL